MAKYYIGICSFTYKGLVEGFYPKGMKPAERISYYAERFNVVEVDSSYYALPSERNSLLFAQRTPENFIFHFKAFGMMTKHRVQTKSLGKALSMYLPPDFDEPFVDHPPEEMLKQAFDMFYGALYPLKMAGKLGVVLFQYPPYFTKRDENMDYILKCKEWMKDYRLAIEFRHSSWTREEELEDTLSFLENADLAYVSVDEPQFKTGSTVPPIAAATSDVAYVRFHGRNAKNWFRRAGVEARYDYLYGREELEEWVPKVEDLAETTREVHVMFNNCVRTYPVQNAQEMADMLGVTPGKKRVELADQQGLGF